VHDSSVVYGALVPIARDLSAPWALMYRLQPPVILEGFINPDDSTVQPKLLMLEPYQPGKIPVLFIHGLASSPLAWFNAVNELSAHRDLYRQYQFWAYRYPTGGAVLESAAALREDLYDVRQQFDPNHQDAALDRMVVVAHSLGGLVTKLQITDSGDILWNHLARAPLDAVRATPEMRASLARWFFFQPVPMIQRVVFAGTPFRGSSWARRTVGRISSTLVRFAGSEEVEYQELMQANRDIFDPYLWRKRPTSIDMLESTSPILAALAEMPVNPQVNMHTIIGTGAIRVLREPSDGVVTMSSAEQPGVVSERLVPARHTGLHDVPETMNELVGILRLHAEQAPANPQPELGQRPGLRPPAR
jgi:pimeloyl-ACP methyl ester carboxylesterase